ncbi:MAG TPA: DUF4145 domain-containing protein [Companilactobacillus farciminis]|uniref:DUF4145 domain-containing protein n=1 Tax=Companilactobacillus farciminis TaxID=1612 RepID=A0A921HT12_9LACO|nr:DUF4145 domain-containing protein [Companilactobacillus farciminis]
MEKIRIKDERLVSQYCCIEYPEICPECGSTMFPVNLSEGMEIASKVDSTCFLGYIVFMCSKIKCRNIFIQSYQVFQDTEGDDPYQLTAVKLNHNLLPPVNLEIDNRISTISRNFINIYKQALQSELVGLDQISGVGYRKSLEFLVKDYLIHIKPNDADNIKKLFLGTVINNYLKDQPDLQNLATAATWIGNGETHYINEYSPEDIQDMKDYIKSFSYFVSSKLAIEEATRRVNHNRSSK